MPVQRHFLGWDAPVTEKVRGFLLPRSISGPVDLGGTLIVVPTRQASRRLREALALHCAEKGTALLSPHVVPPTFFFRPAESNGRIASPVEVAAAWASALMDSDIRDFKDLFPSSAVTRDFSWAMAAGAMIQRLRDRLVDGGYRIADVTTLFADTLQEPERWRDLSRIEGLYLDRLAKIGRADPYGAMIALSGQPEIPGGIEHVIVAAVSDPTPLTVRALEKVSERLPVTVLVHAPASRAGFFDAWGRPLPEKWRNSPIDIPDAHANILLSAAPAAQSRAVIELIAGESGRFAAAEIAIGVPDGQVIPFIEADLEEKGLPVFDPAGKEMGGHPFFQLLSSFRDLVNEGGYTAFASLLRHADFNAAVCRKQSLSPLDLLTELDLFQNAAMPLDWKDIARAFPEGKRAAGRSSEFPSLARAVAQARGCVNRFRKESPGGAVRRMFRETYGHRSLNPLRPEDEEFIAAADLLDTALHELNDRTISTLGLRKGDSLDLLLESLRGQRYYPERKNEVIDCEGWLELPWNDAPFLVVTGMNEGRVPDGTTSDVFLPDSLRQALSLRSDAEMLARDAFVMTGLIESRRRTGRVCFITGKTSGVGEPLKPSRLLFRCRDDDLPNRARTLCAPPPQGGDNYPATISFRLDARPPAGLSPRALELDKLSVSAFRDFLDCPFRFYLKRLLRMQELSDGKEQLDPMEFGSLVHAALHSMAKDAGISRCGDAGKVGAFLRTEAERWVKKRFGPVPSLTIGIQLDAAKQRLSAAAREHVRQAEEGWDIVACEQEVSGMIGGILVRGRIDRIDRNRNTGHLRILDYKTSETGERPAAAHLAPPRSSTKNYALLEIPGKKGKAAVRRWADLQLPLYLMLLPDREEFRGRKDIGYFTIPKAVNETGVEMWEGFDDHFLASARACAGGVIDDIRHCRFWPPSDAVKYDDFTSIFPALVADCIDVAAFESFMENMEAERIHQDGGPAPDGRCAR